MGAEKAMARAVHRSRTGPDRTGPAGPKTEKLEFLGPRAGPVRAGPDRTGPTPDRSSDTTSRQSPEFSTAAPAY